MSVCDQGTQVLGSLDGHQLFNLPQFPVMSSGWAAIGTGSYVNVQFDNFSVHPAGTAGD